jgi:arylsulfatase A-like enzyme
MDVSWRSVRAWFFRCAPIVVFLGVTSFGCRSHQTSGGGSSSAASPRGEFKPRPNIILIVADDLGYADLGCQHISTDVRTPHIDSLATNGVRMTNGYVSGTLCSPTRAGLLTGRYQQRFGHELNPGPDTADTFGLPLDQITLPQQLKNVGYTTAMVGKWHLGTRPEMHPTQRGFDEFFGFLGGAHGYDIPGAGRNVLQRSTTPVGKTDYLTDAFTREAVHFIDRQARAQSTASAAGAEKQPFFLYLTYNAVHTPLQAPPQYLARVSSQKDDDRRTMLAMLTAMDDGVGQILAKLREQKLEEDTLIIFLSDNGGPTHANASRNTPFRGVKNTTWDGGIHVPFIVQWKASLPAGKVYEQPVISLDIAPTIFSVAGVSTLPKGRYDGVELLPYLSGANTAPPHDALYWRSGEQWAIRAGNYKLTRADVSTPAKLFDLSKDPGESNDLAASHPDVVQSLRAKFSQWNAQLIPPLWHDLPEERSGQRLARLASEAPAQSR